MLSGLERKNCWTIAAFLGHRDSFASMPDVAAATPHIRSHAHAVSLAVTGNAAARVTAAS